jgi:hypothetical protein
MAAAMVAHLKIMYCVWLYAALLLPTMAYSQALSLDELTALQRKTPAEANDFLTAKGWEFQGAEEAANNN